MRKFKLKKAKQIHLTETTLLYFSIAAAKAGTRSKLLIETLLENIAAKAK